MIILMILLLILNIFYRLYSVLNHFKKVIFYYYLQEGE